MSRTSNECGIKTAIVIENIVKALAALLSGGASFLAPFGANNPNISWVLLYLNISALACTFIVSVIEAVATTKQADRNEKAKALVNRVEVANSTRKLGTDHDTEEHVPFIPPIPAQEGSMIHVAIKVTATALTCVATSLSAVLNTIDDLTQRTTISITISIITSLVFALSSLFNFTSTSAGGLYLKAKRMEYRARTFM
jgi:hypothetical protein